MRWLYIARVLLATAILYTQASFAGTNSGGFSVHIYLNANDGSGICISSTQSQQTNASVKVTCQGGQFVSIEPRLNKGFFGVHGGAFRFSFTDRSTIPIEALRDGKLFGDWVGNGTVTALRVMNMIETDEKLELLVSF